MIIDLSDPAISSTYRQIINRENKDWLIIGYSRARDALHLVDSGAGGPETLRNHMGPHSNDVLFMLIQAGENSLVLICYIPPTVGGVKRARAIVHARAVEDVFPARRAVLNISSDVDITPASLERLLKSSPLPPRKPAAPTHLSAGLYRPMSPPRSSEEGHLSHPLPRLPSASLQPQERGLPLNLPEPLDPERRQELEREHDQELKREQQINAARIQTPSNDPQGPTVRTPSPKPRKPQLSVAVPPRGERGLRPIEYDDFESAYGGLDDNDDDEVAEEEDDSPVQENLVLRHHSRPSSRGPTPPPGPSILRHPSPIPRRSDFGTSTASAPTTSHIRFTGPPKDHPHPDHHPLKPTDQITSVSAPTATSDHQPLLSHTPACVPPANNHPISNPSTFQRVVGTSRSDESPAVQPASGSSPPHPHPSAVAPSLLHSTITWQPPSQPGQGQSNNALNSAQAPQILQPDHDQMTPPPNSLQGRPLPALPPNMFSALSNASRGSSFAAHSRDTSVSTTPGQTHVPSGTLSAFGRRPSVSSTQQNGANIPSIAQVNHASANGILDRSSIASSSNSTTHRPIQVQTQGMTEAQAQAARSRAKWAAEEQGIAVPPSSVPIASLRSPPLTPPTSPPRSLSVDEAGRVRRDGVERMRREAERRREEDEKKRIAEERRKANAEQQLKLDQEMKDRREKELAEREVKRKEMEVRKRVMEEEQVKKRAEEKTNMRDKFGEVRGTDEVFLTGHVNIQAENTMTWKRRFYELTARGRLSLYKSSDVPDRIKPLDTIDLKGAQTINRGADELELIPYAFRLEFGGGKGSWSFYADSQHDMDILTDGMTWTMG